MPLLMHVLLHLSKHPMCELIHNQQLLHKPKVPQTRQARALARSNRCCDIQPQLLQTHRLHASAAAA
jgi:hypothetical protein